MGGDGIGRERLTFDFQKRMGRMEKYCLEMWTMSNDQDWSVAEREGWK